MRLFMFAAIVASVLGAALMVGLFTISFGPGNGSAGTASAATSNAFTSTETWDVKLSFQSIPGLNTDLGPRTFGLFPICSTAFEPETFINGEACDAGRIVAFGVPYKVSFHYPANADNVGGQDGKRLLTSRYKGDASKEILTWPVRVEIAGSSQGQQVVFSWVSSDIAAGPAQGNRPVVLKAGQLDGTDVKSVGATLVDFRTGAGSGGVTCSPVSGGHSCTLLTVGSGQTSVDRLYVIEVGEEPAPLADAAFTFTPATGREGEDVTFNGTSSGPSSSGTAIVDYSWDFGDGSPKVTGDPSVAGIVTHRFPDNGTFNVTLEVLDNASPIAGQDTASAAITVDNVAPNISSVTATDQTVDEGTPTTIAVTATDVVADTTAGLGYLFDCDDNGTFEPVGTGATANSHQCSFPDDSVHKINVRVRDKDGGETDQSIEVTVNNVAPTVGGTGDRTANEGQATFKVDVKNVAPTITSVAADPRQLPKEGGVVAITVTATDPANTGGNVLDPLLYSIDCNGDGDFDDATSGDIANTGGNTVNCTFPAVTAFAARLIKVQVVDGDDGVTPGQLTVNQGAAVDLSIVPALSTAESGATGQLSLVVTADSPVDSITAVVKVGWRLNVTTANRVTGKLANGSCSVVDPGTTTADATVTCTATASQPTTGGFLLAVINYTAANIGPAPVVFAPTTTAENAGNNVLRDTFDGLVKVQGDVDVTLAGC